MPPTPGILDFSFDPAQTTRTLALLRALGRGGPRVVAIELNKGVLIWKREIVRHHPVDSGLARASWDVDLANPATAPFLFADAGSNVPYVIYLEFGTDLIAGGAVKAWKPGQQPILDWPAKRADAADTTVIGIDDENRGRTVSGEVGSSRSTSSAEFMPPVRGSWPLVLPIVQRNLRARLVQLIRSRGKA